MGLYLYTNGTYIITRFSHTLERLRSKKMSSCTLCNESIDTHTFERHECDVCGTQDYCSTCLWYCHDCYAVYCIKCGIACEVCGDHWGCTDDCIISNHLNKCHYNNMSSDDDDGQ